MYEKLSKVCKIVWSRFNWYSNNFLWSFLWWITSHMYIPKFTYYLHQSMVVTHYITWWLKTNVCMVCVSTLAVFWLSSGPFGWWYPAATINHWVYAFEQSLDIFLILDSTCYHRRPFMSNLYSRLAYSTEESQAFQVIVLVVFSVVD